MPSASETIGASSIFETTSVSKLEVSSEHSTEALTTSTDEWEIKTTAGKTKSTTTPPFPMKVEEKVAVTVIHSIGSTALLGVLAATMLLFIVLQ